MKWKLFADIGAVAGERDIAISLEDGATVGDALDALVADRPALRDRVLDESGALADHVTIFVNGAEISNPDGLERTVADDDELALFPPMSGG